MLFTAVLRISEHSVDAEAGRGNLTLEGIKCQRMNMLRFGVMLEPNILPVSKKRVRTRTE